MNGPTPLTTLVDTPCPCILLLGSNVDWYFSSSVSVTIPCGPFWVGKVLKTQNVDLFGAGPVCPLPVPGSMTDITHVLIGS